MSIAERHYRILLVSSEDDFIKEVGSFLQDDCLQQDVSRNASDARSRLLENPYDIVIINAPLNDESGSRLCADISRSNGTIVAVFAEGETYDDIYSKASARGVFVLGKPASKTMTAQTLFMMLCSRERLRTLEKKIDKAESKLDEFRVVNKAKWLLIENEEMSEADAHRYVEKSAMDAGITKRLAAQIIINSYSD